MANNQRKDLSTLSDIALIDQYKETGKSVHVGELYKRYTHLVFGVCMKYFKNTEEAKDATMGIFEKLMVDLKQHEVQNFKGWLWQVSRNYCLMILRKSKPKIESEDALKKIDGGLVESDKIFHLNNSEVKEEQLTSLEEAIKHLKVEQRKCIELFYLEDKSYTEVAEKTGYSLKEVKSYIQNGKRNLQIKMKETQNE